MQSLPIVPAQDGSWSRPNETYRRSGDLAKALGEATHLWLDESRIPNVRSVHTFIDSLGIRREPTAQHLVERILSISENSPPSDAAKRDMSETFYVLCDHFEEWKDAPLFKNAIARLRKPTCFPAEDDTATWHSAESLHAPYRAEAFSSQVDILDLRNTARLKTALLEQLGVILHPATHLVIDHLKYCVQMNIQPHHFTFQVLNERAQRSDKLIPLLARERCIYLESQKTFVRPNQLYWSPQQLGRYAFTIPSKLEAFKPLFSSMGVKNAPDGQDFVDILLDIVEGYFEQSKTIAGADRSVYDSCLKGVAAADDREEIDVSDIRRLQVAPTILNLDGQPSFPDELLLKDSEWHAGFFEGELDQTLCNPAPELWPLIEKIGVRRLSESTNVTLEFVDGTKSNEPQLVEKLTERIGILIRVLHDKPTMIKTKMLDAINTLSASGYDGVRVQAYVRVVGDGDDAPNRLSEPKSIQAFYNLEKQNLVVARPVADRSWPHVLNAIFHQIMPEEPGNEIAKLTGVAGPRMRMSVEEAHQDLTDSGFPRLEIENRKLQNDDLTSVSLDGMGSKTYPGEPTPLAALEDEESIPESPSARQPAPVQKTPHVDIPPFVEMRSSTEAPDAPELESNSDGQFEGHDESNSSLSPTSGVYERKPRPAHKDQWDRRLLSYVRKRHAEFNESNEQDGPSEHNLAIEVLSRAAVYEYEKARGRIPEPMSQTHPGYDIISRNPLTGEDRLIEVKGVNGEWNQTGVGLSKLQFSNAQDYGDRYWLYVVEFVSNSEHTRVHPICSPATQVTSFMFDGSWRDAVNDERIEPAIAFIPGARVEHQHFGFGRIESMELRGSTRLMLIKFETGGQRRVTLNLHVMAVVKESDDNDHP